MGSVPRRYAFTIPSLYDGIRLDCRLYHPQTSQLSDEAYVPQKAAIVAHPYAPLGGCFDDPVVNVMAEELLNKGYVVGTFNLRYRRCLTSRSFCSWGKKPREESLY